MPDRQVQPVGRSGRITPAGWSERFSRPGDRFTDGPNDVWPTIGSCSHAKCALSTTWIGSSAGSFWATASSCTPGVCASRDEAASAPQMPGVCSTPGWPRSEPNSMSDAATTPSVAACGARRRWPSPGPTTVAPQLVSESRAVTDRADRRRSRACRRATTGERAGTRGVRRARVRHHVVAFVPGPGPHGRGSADGPRGARGPGPVDSTRRTGAEPGVELPEEG